MPFDLERFVTAQQPVYAAACEELEVGRKTSHWMWFVFPQLRALGRSATAKFFGLEGLAEAAAYWAHPVLRERLLHCTQLVLGVQVHTGRSIHQIFGSPDDLKLCSCMTLFEAAAAYEPSFGLLLQQGFAGKRDDATLALLRSPKA
jgi:uncharacterized protein (DUF1810 family)